MAKASRTPSRSAVSTSSAPAPSAARSARTVLNDAWRYVWGDGIIPFFLQLLIAFVVIKFVFFPVLGLLFGTQLPIVAVMSGSMEHGETNGVVCGAQVPDSYGGSFDEYWATCGSWYEARGIDKAAFSEFPLHRGFNKGDIMVIVGPRRAIAVGDVIVYQARESYPIIHRVIGVTQTATGIEYQTKGDYNQEQIAQYVVADAAGRASYCHVAGKPASCVAGERVTRETPGAIALLDEEHVSADAVIGRAVLRVPLLGWVKIGVANAFNAVTS